MLGTQGQVRVSLLLPKLSHKIEKSSHVISYDLTWFPTNWLSQVGSAQLSPWLRPPQEQPYLGLQPVLWIPEQLDSMCLKLNPNLTCLPADCYTDPTEFQANMYDKKQLKNPKFLEEKKKKKKSCSVIIHETRIFHSIPTKSMTWYLSTSCWKPQLPTNNQGA